MLPISNVPTKQSDVTGTIDLNNPGAVADAVSLIMGKRYGHQTEAPIRQAFSEIESAFWGRYPGLLWCDTPYHDLRHSLGTALLMARMVDGYARARVAGMPELEYDTAVLAVLLALFHDIGFLRRTSEHHLNGANLIHEHEQRSVDFVKTYLAQGPFAHLAEQAELIHATNFSQSIADTLNGLSKTHLLIGQMLGTADLMSQIAGRYYLERCYYFLFSEFVVAGMDRTTSPSGEVVVLYASPEALLCKTPGFFDNVVKRRLDVDFEQASRYIAPHFDGEDPYREAIRKNLEYLQDMIRRNDFSGLNRRPVPLIPAPQYEKWLSVQSGV